jgi:hypothetical protein
MATVGPLAFSFAYQMARNVTGVIKACPRSFTMSLRRSARRYMTRLESPTVAKNFGCLPEQTPARDGWKWRTPPCSLAYAPQSRLVPDSLPGASHRRGNASLCLVARRPRAAVPTGLILASSFQVPSSPSANPSKPRPSALDHVKEMPDDRSPQACIHPSLDRCRTPRLA